VNATKQLRIAVPSGANGGLSAPLDPHFGRCTCFTVVEVAADAEHKVILLENLAHHDCQGPVDLLNSHGVKVVIVGGIGMRPRAAFIQAGIALYRSDGGSVGELVDDYLQGRLQPLDDTGVCGGGQQHFH